MIRQATEGAIFVSAENHEDRNCPLFRPAHPSLFRPLWLSPPKPNLIGGNRVVLFHLGAVGRLNEFGILTRLKVISPASGGSIVSSGPQGLPEVVRSGRLGPEHEQHA